MRILLLIILLGVLNLRVAVAVGLDVVVPTDVLRSYSEYLMDRDVQKISDYSGVGSRRDVIEIVLLQQALYLGGLRDPLRFKAVDSYARIQKEIDDGRVVAGATSIWLSDLQTRRDKVYISAALIADGEFEAGFYARYDNAQALSATSLDDVRQLSVISNPAWVADWETLTQLNMKHLESAVQWSLMVKMVKGGRVDLLLAPFQTGQDMAIEAEGVKFIPIPGLKVGLKGSRHFAVSRKHARGPAFYEALERGLRKMHAQGVIKKAYQQCGFFNPRVVRWLRLN